MSDREILHLLAGAFVGAIVGYHFAQVHAANLAAQQQSGATAASDQMAWLTGWGGLGA